MSIYEGENNLNAAQWMVLGGGQFRVCGPTRRRLPAEAYSCTVDCYYNSLFQQRDLKVDDLHEPSSAEFFHEGVAERNGVAH